MSARAWFGQPGLGTTSKGGSTGWAPQPAGDGQQLLWMNTEKEATTSQTGQAAFIRGEGFRQAGLVGRVTAECHPRGSEPASVKDPLLHKQVPQGSGWDEMPGTNDDRPPSGKAVPVGIL